MERANANEVLARSRAARSVHGGQGADFTSQPRVDVPVEPTVPADGVPRRTGRGHLMSFGEGRVCATVGCKTRLSRYNDHTLCAEHDGQTRGAAG